MKNCFSSSSEMVLSWHGCGNATEHEGIRRLALVRGVKILKWNSMMGCFECHRYGWNFVTRHNAYFLQTNLFKYCKIFTHLIRKAAEYGYWNIFCIKLFWSGAQCTVPPTPRRHFPLSVLLKELSGTTTVVQIQVEYWFFFLFVLRCVLSEISAASGYEAPPPASLCAVGEDAGR